MTLTVSDDFVKAAVALDRRGFERQAGRLVKGGLRKAGNAVRKHVRREAPKRTGRLRGNVRIFHMGEGMDAQTKVRASGPVAHLVAGGVAPHTIEPGKVMALHGPGRSGPLIGFATVVQHPGFAGDPFFARGVRLADGDIDKAFDETAEKMAEELAFRIKRGR